jgi:cytochrome c-type biogenesis protein CcmH/NrfG
MSLIPDAPPTESQRLRDQAQAAMADGRPADAVATLTGLVRLMPADDGLWAMLAAAQLAAGAVEAAITAGEKAIEVMPVNVEYL